MNTSSACQELNSQLVLFSWESISWLQTQSHDPEIKIGYSWNVNINVFVLISFLSLLIGAFCFYCTLQCADACTHSNTHRDTHTTHTHRPQWPHWPEHIVVSIYLLAHPRAVEYSSCCHHSTAYTPRVSPWQEQGLSGLGNQIHHCLYLCKHTDTKPIFWGDSIKGHFGNTL